MFNHSQKSPMILKWMPKVVYRIRLVWISTMNKLNFDNQVLKRLPLDKEHSNHVRSVDGACFSRIKTTPLSNPIVVSYSKEALSLLGISEENVEGEKEDFALYFSGNKLLPGSEPAAHCYCGHQFGNFAGQLGDGTVA